MPENQIPVPPSPEEEKTRQEAEKRREEAREAQEAAQQAANDHAEAQQKSREDALKEAEKAQADREREADDAKKDEEAVRSARIETAKTLSDAYYKIDAVITKIREGLTTQKDLLSLRDRVYILKNEAEALCQTPGTAPLMDEPEGTPDIPQQHPLQASSTRRITCSLLFPRLNP